VLWLCYTCLVVVVFSAVAARAYCGALGGCTPGHRRQQLSEQGSSCNSSRTVVWLCRVPGLPSCIQTVAACLDCLACMRQPMARVWFSRAAALAYLHVPCFLCRSNGHSAPLPLQPLLHTRPVVTSLLARALSLPAHIIPRRYISALLLSLSTMLHLELPHVNVLSKVDLVPQYGQLGEWEGGEGCVCSQVLGGHVNEAWQCRLRCGVLHRWPVRIGAVTGYDAAIGQLGEWRRGGGRCLCRAGSCLAGAV
jgi:hypothetical protein